MSFICYLVCVLLVACSDPQATVNANKKVEAGDTVYLHFTLYDSAGQKIDESNHQAHQYSHESTYPLRLVAGRGHLIEGFDEAILGSTSNDSSFISIPPEKAYGKQGVRPFIEPDETLRLSYKILEIKKKQE